MYILKAVNVNFGKILRKISLKKEFFKKSCKKKHMNKIIKLILEYPISSSTAILIVLRAIPSISHALETVKQFERNTSIS